MKQESASAHSFFDIGQLSFAEARRVQEDLALSLLQGKAEERMLVCEHPPTLTAGKSASANERAQAQNLAAELHYDYSECDRGGRITYHGPGQLVVYPVLNLSARRWGVRRYIQILLNCAAEGLAASACPAFVSLDTPGVWCGRGEESRKIAAVGVRVRHGISLHGISVNISSDLQIYQRFSPCGFAGDRVTSFVREVSEAGIFACEQARKRLLSSFSRGLSIGVTGAERSSYGLNESLLMGTG